jgi:hypothetical protein
MNINAFKTMTPEEKKKKNSIKKDGKIDLIEIVDLVK